MRKLLTFILLALAPAALAQVTKLQYPPLTLTGSSLTVAVSYDPGTQIYRYEYTVNAANTNKASIAGFTVDLAGAVSRPQLDPSLTNNIDREESQVGTFQPSTTIPVGITVPNSGWYGSMSVKGAVTFTGLYPANRIAPGTSAGGFVLQSKQPPGSRTAMVMPAVDVWDNLPAPPEGVEYEPARADTYAVTVSTIGPIDPSDANLFNGGGQQPAEVNKFLRYAQPLDNRVKLAAGTRSYAVIVYYGPTIISSTFNATLDGADITSQFHPIAGSAEVVTIPIGTGTTKLHLSVDGTKS
ncbi:MAG TPA: hypothetical protein VKT80_08180, partial [Chloroflexota bacterium]|nr:hypothetical protein [Chloroflexota bacterium]